MTLDEWALKWGVPSGAVTDLRKQLTQTPDAEVIVDGKTLGSEAEVQARVRLDASKRGARLWRNNLGACMTAEGQFIRYGLANDSKRMNEKVKSSDLIGIRPVLITPRHMGQTLGQFVARECKRVGWVYRGTVKEKAQLKFCEIITGFGGDATFTTGV
jgi:hypothetical protein